MKKIFLNSVKLFYLAALSSMAFVFASCSDMDEFDSQLYKSADEQNELTTRSLVKDEEGQGTVGVQYTIVDNNAEVSVMPKVNEVIIPESITYGGKQYPVTKINKGSYNKEITKLHLPPSIRKIEMETFKDSKVMRLYIDNLQSWCEIEFEASWAFGNTFDYLYCESNPIVSGTILYVNGEPVGKELVIPSGVKSVSNFAFSNLNCRVLSISDDVETIGYESFYNCKDLSEINFGKNLKEIGTQAFFGVFSTYTPKFDELILPSTLEKIGCNVFVVNNSVYFPETLKEVGCGAVIGCKNIHVPSIEYWVDIEYFMDIRINDDGVPLLPLPAPFSPYDLYIGEELVKNLEIPAGTEEIKQMAFCNSKIESVKFPDSLKSIGKGAFDGCRNIKELVIPGSVKTVNCWGNMEAMETLIMEEGVESIGYMAFYECPALQTVILPSTLKECYLDGILEYNTPKKIYSFAPNPPEIKNEFWLPEGEKMAAEFYVPMKYYNAYKAAPQWNILDSIEPLSVMVPSDFFRLASAATRSAWLDMIQ